MNGRLHAFPTKWLTLARRFLVVAALMFWQGGFTFYASVVVPFGQAVFGMEQGFVTQRVTNSLNVAGAAALAILAWDVLYDGGSGWRKSLRWGTWFVMAAALAALIVLHPRLDGLLDAEQMRLLNRAAFTPLHRIYLWVSTIQWAAMLVYLFATLWSWQEARRGGPVDAPEGEPAAELIQS